jgi:hypothetical protein
MIEPVPGCRRRDRPGDRRRAPVGVPPARRPSVWEKQSQVELAGWTFVHQAGAPDIAAHRSKIAMAGVAHDVLVAHALAVKAHKALARSVPPPQRLGLVCLRPAAPRRRPWRRAPRGPARGRCGPKKFHHAIIAPIACYPRSTRGDVPEID